MAAHTPPTQALGITLKLGSFFNLPSRFLARMRRIDEVLNQDHQQNDVAPRRHNWETASSRSASVGPPQALAPFPGPWGFLTSGYAIGLFLMAVLLHRIHNIVVPPRRPFTYHPFPRAIRRPPSLFRLLYASVLPMDFSSVYSRMVFYVPSLYFLIKAMVLWFVIFLQTSNLYSSSKSRWIQNIGSWASHQEMADVCWFTFCAVCGTFCVEALTRGLEGAGTTANNSPFNLCGYAFLLYIYSSPVTHIVKAEGMPSRPDKHVIITIALPLFQLTMIHFLGIRQQWSRQRLVPSMIVSILSLLHFYAVLWCSPASYPLLNYMRCIFESLLVGVTLITVSLNALTQVLLEGTITRPLFGHPSTLRPGWDEDFSIILLRVGIASLDATSVAGLGNEVGGVAVASPLDPNKPYTEYGTVEVNRFGVTSMSPAVEGRGRHRKIKEGLANEIKNVKTGPGEDHMWVDAAWYRELAKFGVGIWKVMKGFWRLLWRAVTGRPRYALDSHQIPGGTPDTRGGSGAEGDDGDVYERFLRGENVSDDEDEEYDPHVVSQTVSRTPSSTFSELASDDDVTGEAAGETAALYADLSSAVSTSTSAPLILAHMTDASPTPLTRRRYRHLVDGPSDSPGSSAEWASFGAQPADDDVATETRRNCVICTVEARQVICWPCRCLAMCDDCRENLASRSSASKHRCPCCRRTVEGYSRIFIP